MAAPRPITATISVQSAGGLAFGGAVQIDGLNVTFELETQMEVGDNVEWRMELPGLDDTAMGRMRILSRRADPGYPVRWVGSITSVSPEDTAIFEVWRRGVEAGTRSFAVSKRAPGDAWLAATTMVGSSEAERKQAVAIEEARRKQRLERAKSLLKNSKSWPDPTDVESGVVAASGVFRASLSGSVNRSAASSHGADPAGRPRLAVAAALRANIGGERPAAPVPTPAGLGAERPAIPSRPPDAVVRRHVAPQVALLYRLSGDHVTFHVDPEAARAAAPSPASMTELPKLLVDRNMAMLRFTEGGSFRSLHKATLAGGIIIVQTADVGPAGTRLDFVITLPSGATIFAPGQVMAHSGGRSEFFLTLSPAQKGTIAAE